jgi:type VI secretion system protein VasG
MSEFQEKHTVSRLIGSPPGYVGYGEGGMLTEAVRQKPYSVVLLDECEKADLEVMNLFYQVFDKGMLTDGEGRQIDFRNTLIILTSNLATDLVMECFEDNPKATADEVTQKIRPVLSRHFQPALLARMSIVPYAPIADQAMRSITRLKLSKLVRRIESAHGLAVVIEDTLIEEIARRCTEAETGARNIDHILRGSLMPVVARALLERMASSGQEKRLTLGLDTAGGFRLDFA